MSAKLPSGRFLLRLPRPLHARLVEAARARGISLNELCVRSLARAEAEASGPFGEVVTRAITQLGAGLVGVAVFGSFARGEAGPESDIDMLFATAPEVEITRSLYAPWDSLDVRVADRRVEPHFMRVPEPDAAISGIWAEIAVDGAVVYDTDLVLARALSAIRRAVMDGALVRRTVAGRSWWAAA